MPFVGGGIAGAGMDSSWAREGAKNYPGFVGPGVSVVRLEEGGSSEQYARNSLLHQFENRTVIADSAPTDFAGVSISFYNQRIKISKLGQTIVTESIPSVFYFAGLQVASLVIDGSPCLLLLTYSRASTGMIWVGLYRTDGTRLYLATASRGDVWDIVPSPSGVTFLGHSSSTIVTIKPE